MDRAIFLDRDGAINEDREDYVKSWEEFRFIRGAKQALKQFNQAGVLIVVITNQSVIGRGLVTEDELFVIHERMTMAVEKARGLIQKIYYCPHHPGERCRCRKLRIGLLEKAGKEMGLDLSLYTILQILSVNLFENIPILRALSSGRLPIPEMPDGNQLTLFK